MEVVDATPVTAGCRIFKSKAEIALMQRANDVTLAAYKAALATLREGMTQDELDPATSSAGFTRLGFRGGVSAAVRQMDRAAPRQRDAADACAKATS